MTHARHPRLLAAFTAALLAIVPAIATAQSRPTTAPTVTALARTGKVQLKWTAVDGASRYQISLQIGSQAPALIATTSQRTFVDEGLTNGLVHRYRVAGLNASGAGPLSSAVRATPLDVPTNLTAVGGDRSVALSWDKVQGATGYDVLRGTAAGSLTKVAVVTTATYLDSGLSNGVLYYYRVQATATNSFSLSKYAKGRPQGATQPLPAPGNLSAAPGDAVVTLAWSPVAGATAYRVYRGTSSNGQASSPVATGLTSPAYSDRTVTNGTTYFYRVTATGPAGDSPRSAEASATPTGSSSGGLDTLSAFRLLRQATWGPKPGDVERVRQMGVDAFLDEQFAARASTYPNSLYDQSLEYAQEHFMSLAVTGPDQLRQRVAWALHKIWVVSGVEIDYSPAYLPYYRILMSRAFGDYRDLMGDITRNPAMGAYLSMLNNLAETETGLPPNENYPRELLQLFTWGTSRLNANGTPMLDARGQPIPSYTEADVKALARITNGWTLGDGNPNTTPDDIQWWGDETQPMEPVERYHDRGEKTFMGEAFLANVDARTELDHALDVIFNHPNVGPFIGRQLIQQLVTSNPSPAYVASVADAFGAPHTSGRGNMAAVLRAIFTHPEASAVTTTSGKLSEPVLFALAIVRALNARVTDHPFLSDLTARMGQRVFYPPSVFSYYSPNYRIAGTGTPPLVGPEFQGLTAVTTLERTNFAAMLLGGWFDYAMSFNYGPFTTRANDPAGLVEYVNQLLMGGRMSAETKAEITEAVRLSPTDSSGIERARTALYLTLVAAQSQVDN